MTDKTKNKSQDYKELNGIDSMYSSAVRYIYSGEGADVINKGIKLLEKASNNNSIEASIMLADLYMRGDFVQKNCDKGMNILKELLRKSNNFKSAHMLGYIYLFGVCGRKDYVLAYNYFNFARKQGHFLSSVLCQKLMLSGRLGNLKRIYSFFNVFLMTIKAALLIAVKKLGDNDRLWYLENYPNLNGYDAFMYQKKLSELKSK